MGEHSQKTTAIREANIRKVLQMAQAPFDPTPGYDDNSLTMAGAEVGRAIKSAREPKYNETVIGATDQAEPSFPIEGPEEGMNRFGDDKEKMGAALARSLSGSKKFTKSEVRRGYRKL